jgi:hypothetical protein
MRSAHACRMISLKLIRSIYCHRAGRPDGNPLYLGYLVQIYARTPYWDLFGAFLSSSMKIPGHYLDQATIKFFTVCRSLTINSFELQQRYLGIFISGFFRTQSNVAKLSFWYLGNPVLWSFVFVERSPRSLVPYFRSALRVPYRTTLK